MAKVHKLFCKRGRHEWEREDDGTPIKELPKSCPEHRRTLSEDHKRKMAEGRKQHAKSKGVDRETKIAEILESSGTCYCEIHPQMSDSELRAKATDSCTNPSYICPTLVRVMSAVYTWDSAPEVFV